MFTKYCRGIPIRKLLGSARVLDKVKFTVPPSYSPSKEIIKKLPLIECLKIWTRSFEPGNLQRLQDELVAHMIAPEVLENSQISIKNLKVPIDNKGNHINELCLEIVNDAEKPTKHIAFIHGYGASLGCFARNFQFINLLKLSEFNYRVHFLDNISFGLSSNPESESPLLQSKLIPKCVDITLNDPEPTDKKKLYRKYYKLIESYSVNVEEFKDYQRKFIPILQDIESYYVDSIDAWREKSGIDKLDYLIGHSYGGYWSGSYAVKNSDKLHNLILLSPVGVERHMQAVTNDITQQNRGSDISKKNTEVTLKPSLDPTSFNFLSRLPILSKKHINNWYFVQPYLPRLLKYLGPFGVRKYFDMWYMKLFKINKLIEKYGTDKLFKSGNDLVYGTNKECLLLIEYLYNSISQGSVSDIYIKHLLTPSTVSKWPLYDKYTSHFKENKQSFKMHLLYGQYDFMNGQAGKKLVDQVNILTGEKIAHYYEVDEGGHNLYIDNPFQVNQLLKLIIKGESFHN